MGDIDSTLNVSIYDDNSGQTSVVDTAGNLAITPRNPSGTAILDTAAHRGYMQLTDGTNLVTVTGGKLDVNATVTASGAVTQVENTGGTATNVGYKTGNEMSMPSVICDYSSPTRRLVIDTNGYLTANQGGTWNIGTVTTLTGITNSVTVGQSTGSNLHTVLDSGTLTSITNAVTVSQATASSLNATVVQGTGSNLHTVLDSGTLTSITNSVTVNQATGTNLHTVLDSGTLTSITNTVTVGQATGSNLHTVLDSGTLTSITNTVDTNLKNVGGTTISATNPVPSRLTDGTAYYTKTGQTTSTAQYVIQTDGTNTQPTLDVAARKGYVQITDGTNSADVDSRATTAKGVNSLILGEYRSSAPTLTNAQVVPIQVDASGKLKVTQISTVNVPVQILFDAATTAAVNGQWQEVATYTVPTNYNYNVTTFDAKSSTVAEGARAVQKTVMGTFVGSTNTFTDGNTLTLPRFATALWIYVTLAVGSGSNDTVTITYTNSAGVAGRTATLTITKSSIAGNRFNVPLQAGDTGIIDITNVTHSATGQAGNYTFEATFDLFFLTLTSANSSYYAPAVPIGSILVYQGESVHLWYLAGAATSQTRRVSLVGALVPT